MVTVDMAGSVANQHRGGAIDYTAGIARRMRMDNRLNFGVTLQDDGVETSLLTQHYK